MNWVVQQVDAHFGGRAISLLVPASPEKLLDDPRTHERFAENEYLPYWAALWPGALLLADIVSRWDRPAAAGPPGRQVDAGPSLAVGVLKDAPVEVLNDSPLRLDGPPSSDATPDDATPEGAASDDTRSRGLASADVLVLEIGCGLGLVGVVSALRGYRTLMTDYDADAVEFARLNAARNGAARASTAVLDWTAAPHGLTPGRILAADVLYEVRNCGPIARFIAAHLAPGGFALLSDPYRSTADGFPALARAAGLVCGVEDAAFCADRGAMVRGRVFRVERQAR